MTRLDDKTKLKVLNLVRRGQNLREVSEIVGINQKTLWNHYGRAIVKAVSPDIDYSKGLSLDEFVRIIGDRESSTKTARMIYLEEKAREHGYDSHRERVKERDAEKMVENHPISSHLKSQLKKIGATVEWAAKAIGVSKQAMYRFLKGLDKPRYERLPRFAYVFETDFETLIRLGRYR